MHPSSNNDVHEFYLMCDDVRGLVDEMQLHTESPAPLSRTWVGGVRTSRHAARRRSARNLSASARAAAGNGSRRHPGEHANQRPAAHTSTQSKEGALAQRRKSRKK